MQLANSTAIVVRAMLDWETLGDYNLTKFTGIKLEDRRKCQAIFTMQRHSTICKLPPMSLTAGRLAIGLNFWYNMYRVRNEAYMLTILPLSGLLPPGTGASHSLDYLPFHLAGTSPCWYKKIPAVCLLFDVVEAMCIPQSKRLCIDMPMYASCTYACAVYFLFFIF